MRLGVLNQVPDDLAKRVPGSNSDKSTNFWSQESQWNHFLIEEMRFNRPLTCVSVISLQSKDRNKAINKADINWGVVQFVKLWYLVWILDYFTSRPQYVRAQRFWFHADFTHNTANCPHRNSQMTRPLLASPLMKTTGTEETGFYSPVVSQTSEHPGKRHWNYDIVQVTGLV